MTSRPRRPRHDHPHHHPLVCDAEEFTRLAASETDPLARELHAAKAHLAGQLERLGDPVDNALEVLTPEEFTDLVWRQPNPGRTNFLRRHRVPSARRLAPAAAAMGLSRLRSCPPDQRLRDARYITTSVVRGLWAHLMRWVDDLDNEALRRALTEDPAQTNAVRLMVVTHWYGAPEAVAALRCALTGGLALPSWPVDVVDGAVDACARLEAVWLDQDDDQDPDWATLGMDATTTSGVEHPVIPQMRQDGDSADTRTGADPEPPGVGEVATGQSSHEGPPDAATLTTAADELALALDITRGAVHQLNQCIAAGWLPRASIIEPIPALYRAVERAQQLIERAETEYALYPVSGEGGLFDASADPAMAADCGALIRTLKVAAEAAQEDQETRDQLRRLTTLKGPETSRAVIAEVRELAWDLTQTTRRDDISRNHVTALTALLRLIDAAADGDSTAAMQYYTIAHQHLPSALTPVVAIALMQQLTVVANAPELVEASDADLEPFPLDAWLDALEAPDAHGSETAEPAPDKAPDDGPTPTAGHDEIALAQATSVSPAEDAAPRGEDDQQTAGDHASEPGRPAPRDAVGVEPADPAATSVRRVVTDSIHASPDSDDLPDDVDGLDTTDDEPRVGVVVPTDAVDGHPTQQVTRGQDPAAGELIASLLRHRQYCLAYHAATAAGRGPHAQALRVLTFAEAVRSETGPTAVALRTAIGDLRVHHLDGNRPAQLALLAGAVRAALVIADPSAGEIVKDVVANLHELPATSKLASAIGVASAQGLLSNSALLKALAPIAGADNDIATAAAQAARERTKPRTIRFARANQVVESWWSSFGLIGSLLDIAANDRRAEVDTVAEALRKLLKRDQLAQELGREDAKLRGTSGRPLEGPARRRLLDHAMESLDAVGNWVDAVRTDPGPEQSNTPVPTVLAELRAAVHREFAAAHEELQMLADTNANVVLAAAADACLASLTRSVQLLDGSSLTGTEPDPATVLNRELLRSPSLRMDDKLHPLDQITIEHIATAATTSWTVAFDGRLANEDYVAARTIVDAVPETDEGQAEAMSARLEQNITRSRTELKTWRAVVSARVDKAARLGQLGSTEYAQVIAQLEAARVDRQDLGAVRRQLDGISEDLPTYAEQAKQALRMRAQQELNAAAGRVADTAAETITACIDTGDLATAEEYLLSALAGEVPPTAAASGHLAEFMTVAKTFRGGVDGELLRAAQDGTTASGLDFSRLSDAARTAAHDGLKHWLEMKTNRHQRTMRMKSVFASALRLAGIEFTGERQPYKLTIAPNRKWIELTGFKRMPRAVVPAFGTLTDDRLKMMMCWGVQDAQTLLTWIAQDPSTDPILVAMFGTMTLDQRNMLAKACAERADRPIMVLDDTAIAYLATTGGGQFPTTERILLPFAATNPYHPHAIGNVPQEMFFGRTNELQRVIEPFGSSLIYGGRQLGKSALLLAAARQFELVPERVAVYLSLPGGFGSTDQVDDLWSMLADKLNQRDIVPPRRRPRDGAQFVETAVNAWLDANPNRRLLLLLDECDGFFDADAKAGFRHTTRLRDLMNTSNRRFKPVFAGLHQVQRFAHLPNQPLAGAHFGDPIAIGPLAPDPAYRLMFTPMETLGITIEADELVHRVLAYCNYQPKLLQLVGEALVRESLSRRGAEGPNYLIRDEDLERVFGSDTVKQKVRETVQLTLNLDSRYKLIALVVALDALANGADHAIDTNMLRDECQDWWPEGFSRLRPDEFRSLLSEMSGLGVLAEKGGQWRLRSSNVLRLLGTKETIEDELCEQDWSASVTHLSAEQARRTLKDGSISPLTERQLATLIERGNRLLVVVGTPATGIDRVETLLKEEASRTGARFTLHGASGPSSYRRELVGGTAGDKHRVVLSKLSGTRLENAIGSLVNEQEMLPNAGVTRSVVAVVDASTSDLFIQPGAPDLSEFTDQIIVMRRLSPAGLRSWVASETDKVASFSDDASQRMLMEATGGWRILLDEAVQHPASGRSARRVCETISAKLASGELAVKLIEEVGIADNATLVTAFNEMLGFNEPMTPEDLTALFEVTHCGGARSVAMLRYLDVVEERSSDGKLELEPVFAAAWKTIRGQ
ncbi:hypothetical protein [Micromonospora vulcania]|uniref:AAA domain-containing protein n=1 Tax=Micromonospora vulcania TaxID=1441873 RepID=A0ABW1GZH4_9ACTN